MARRLILVLVASLVAFVAGPVAAQGADPLPPGTYLLEFELAEDDCGHDPFIDELPPSVTIVVGPNGELVIGGEPPWVEIEATVGADGRIVGTGTGTVAGFDGVTVDLEGAVTGPGVMEGVLGFGIGGELPGGCPIRWTLTLISETPVTTAAQTTVPETTLPETTLPETTVPETTVAETATTVATETTPAPTPTTVAGDDSGGGGWIWIGPIVVGLLAIAIGLLMLARRKRCEDELEAWLAAKQACDEAQADEQRAEAARDQAQQKLDRAEDDVDDHCAGYPPACADNDPRDSWIEDSDVPGSRIDGLDVAAGRAWSREVWGQYRNGQLSAQGVEQAWEQGPSDAFKEAYRDRYPAEKARHDQLEQARQQAEADLQQAEADLTRARTDRQQKCAAAEAARRALELCLARPVPPTAGPGGGEGGTDGGGGDPGPTAPGEPSQEPPCTDGTEREAGSQSVDVNVPVSFQPVILGGDAHAAAERAREIANELRQAEIVAQALGRILGLAPGAKLVEDFTVGGAIETGVSVGSAATGVPIPTNPAEAAANAIELSALVARVIIGAVPEWQERRLPDVELRIQWKLAPFRLTCTRIEVCRNGVWVEARHRLSLERTGPDRPGPQSNRGGGFTWADAQREIQRFASSFSRSQRRALADMKRFRDGCATGG
ncbi:MAG TPA: hypothetical protein VLA10_04290 [Ilumatobacter sp.]|nr:hypothetical protein [Ilumatobacter sp.]